MSWTKENRQDLVNHIAYIVDASGSMSGLRRDVISVMKQKVKDLLDLNKKHDTRTTITFATFNTTVTIHTLMLNLDNEKPDNHYLELFDNLLDQYTPIGGTALIDGVLKILKEFENAKDAHLKTTSFVIEAITDGYENSSTNTATELREQLSKAIATDRVTIGFQVPMGYVKEAKKLLGLRDGEIIAWETTQEGLRQSYAATNLGMQTYYATRRAGGSSLKGLYTTNVATVKEVEKATTNITKDVKTTTVEKEASIKEWYEAKYKEPYSIGSCFYELTKRETIQKYKQILLLEKTTGKIFQAESRSLLGIPTDKDVKVDPGNHRKYKVLVQSTSTNRKLVRGTTVAIWKNAPVKGTCQIW